MSHGTYSIWLHPWDLFDEGADTVLHNIADLARLDTVNLAVSYHSGKFQPLHNPKHSLYYAEDGVVYFSPHTEAYHSSRILPAVSRNYPEDSLALLTERARSFGLRVATWVVCNHNSRLCQEHPEAAIQTIDGDREVNFLCPNNPDVRKYVLGLVEDIGMNYDIQTFDMESPGYPDGVSHGFHHEFLTLPLEPLMDQLLSTCFCGDCERKAKEFGVNLQEVRAKLIQIIHNWRKIPVPVLESTSREKEGINFLGALLSEPTLLELFRFKKLVVNEVLSEAREKLPKGIELNLITLPLSSNFPEDCSFLDASKICDSFELLCYTKNHSDVYYDAFWTRQLTRPDCRLSISLRSGYPAITSAELLTQQAGAARKAGADGLSFYNYGATPLTMFPAIGALVGKD